MVVRDDAKVKYDKYVVVEERFKRPDAEYPDGSYLKKIGGEVVCATGQYASNHPDRSNLAWYGDKPTFVMLDTSDWPKTFTRQE